MKKNYVYQFPSQKSYLLLFAKFFLVGIFLLIQLNASAQQERTISGLVIGVDKAPIPGVTVLIKGTTIGKLTDSDGRFVLAIPATAQSLEISFVGMQSQEIKIGPGNVYDVILLESVVGLEEVVVVGYGVQKKESVVGAITQVDNAAIVKSGVSTVTNAIAGKLSGVLTIQRVGEPGADESEIIVRGLSSWNTSAPLVLVDGVERDFSDMDPNEIETISVLKDASATAVFGAKGANGVIIVTTRRGLLGKPVMSLTSSYGFQRATQLPPFTDAYTTMSMYNVALMNGQLFTDLVSPRDLEQYRQPSSPLNALKYPSIDWFRLLTKPFAPEINTNLTISGGTNFVKYFASLGYYFEGDFFKSYNKGYDDQRFWYKRLNYRSNFDFSLTNSTMLSLNVGGEVGIKNNTASPDGVWYDLYRASVSHFPAYYPAWVLNEVPDLDYPDANEDRIALSTDYNGNPYLDLNNGSFTRSLESKLFTDLLLDQKLDFIIKGLSFRAKVSLSTYYQNQSLYTNYSKPQYRLDFTKIGSGANPWERNGQGNEIYTEPLLNINIGGLGTNFNKFLYYETSLNYSNTFGKHNITGLALMNRQERDLGIDFPYYNEALVGRITYDYSHKYLLELNVGYTGSERFAPKNRFGFFPSGAVGWVISNESFFKNAVPWMNKLKLRYSDGLVGSDYAQNRWLYVSSYFKDANGYVVEDQGANVSAQWEEARKRDIGIEAGFFQNLFTINVDLFDEQRSKMLLTPRSVTFIVGNSFKDLNLGSLKKHGIEIEAEFNKTTSTKINYYIKGIFGYNENRVLFKDDPVYAPEYTKDQGKPVGAQVKGVGLTGTGYYTSVDDIHINPAPAAIDKINVGDYKFLDYYADGLVTLLDEFPIKGNLYPPITYSLSGGLTYKGFDLHIMFQGNEGKYVIYNLPWECEFVKGSYRVHESQLNYWRPDNQDVNHGTLHYTKGGGTEILQWGGGEGNNSGYDLMIPGRLWRDASYVRLKEVYLGYTFNSKSNFLKQYTVSNLLVYVSANNLFTITSLIEGDPESTRFNYGYYPQMTTLSFGVKFSF